MSRNKEQIFTTLLSSNLEHKYFTFSERSEFLQMGFGDIDVTRNNRKIKYFDIPCAFDIETTSFYLHDGRAVLNPIDKDTDEKQCCMYGWTFGVNGLVLLGRTWQEFTTLLNEIIDYLKLSLERRLIIAVHNLSYEFQWLCKLFEWEKVFAVDTRKPVYAVTNTGLEFRCTYLLSGKSLASVGNDLTRYKCKKLVNDLDYNKLRHTRSFLTNTEIGYMVNDVKVVMCYVAELLQDNTTWVNIPLTKTGFVRNYCRNKCLYTDGMSHKQCRTTTKYKQYRELMERLTLTPDIYKQLRRAFQGGFTHCNPAYSGVIMNDVTSYDFTSSYPAVMLSEQFPMSAGEYIQIQNRDDFIHNIKCYCCLFDVRFTGLCSKVFYDSYLSTSHCWNVQNPIKNNGRLVSADMCETTITDIDYLIINKFYKWDKMEIAHFCRFKRGYLPRDFVGAIIELYQKKTTLKGVTGVLDNGNDAEQEYLLSKEMLNSCYGMSVTDICRDEQIYNGQKWTSKPADINKDIYKYNSSKRRFLYYPWGVWVTAYARLNLFTGIVECAGDYVYSDTDSIKILNVENHKDYITRYNERIKDKLIRAMQVQGFTLDDVQPQTIKGEPKLIGVWDYDGHYTRFKSLGAKRYMVEKNDEINITVSGLNKKVCVPWLVRTFGKNVFDKFDDGLYIPAEYTGKRTHTYIDEPMHGTMTDYTGVTATYNELSGIHLSGCDYDLSLASEYLYYIKGVRETYG